MPDNHMTSCPSVPDRQAALYSNFPKYGIQVPATRYLLPTGMCTLKVFSSGGTLTDVLL